MPSVDGFSNSNRVRFGWQGAPCDARVWSRAGKGWHIGVCVWGNAGASIRGDDVRA